MVERPPSMREIRIAYEELADATPDDPGAERSRKIAQALMERFPDAPREKLGEAMVLAADIGDRTATREQLAGLVTKFMHNSTRSTVNHLSQ